VHWDDSGDLSCILCKGYAKDYSFLRLISSIGTATGYGAFQDRRTTSSLKRLEGQSCSLTTICSAGENVHRRMRPATVHSVSQIFCVGY